MCKLLPLNYKLGIQSLKTDWKDDFCANGYEAPVITEVLLTRQTLMLQATLKTPAFKSLKVITRKTLHKYLQFTMFVSVGGSVSRY